jgi:hypothetical protein
LTRASTESSILSSVKYTRFQSRIIG